MKTLFIGAGSMAYALMSGALKAGVLMNEKVHVTNRANQERLNEIVHEFGVRHVEHDSPYDVVILAMKPKDFHEAADSIRTHLSRDTVVISVLAGITMEHISDKLSFNGAIARAMPNTSAAMGKSATAVSFNRYLSDSQKEWTTTLFQSVGTAVEVAEEQLDLITALSGSGPAYIYYVAELLKNAAVELGLQEELAKSLVTQTIAGASAMLAESGLEARELRRNVTSPGGTTEAGITTLEDYQVRDAFFQCVSSAKNRSEVLGKELKKQSVKK
ncbi:pyrroline-5-carboxylate reductase [Rossellomorea aquimaris]|uniref:Pyrroline-5-carboxylate reductase n=1 Tax=Rossellomorea aquimaris TaxID=189382 RepID=A0A366EZ22_9BACI|nr:pyrroline-5-carboxylate reductase [Rossellomorea aquimaris]RBP07672.1 pyrroline-5-carboxylate reductase [Rossellomorea aquimaris]